LTALTADNTDNAKKANTNTNTTNTTTKKKFKKSTTTTTTKKPDPTSIIRKFVPPRLDVSFYFHLIIFIKLI
jgi:hypothetical protein